MIVTFNGVDVESVAPIKIVDVLVGSVQRAVTATDRAIAPGAYFVRSRDGTRTVQITFALLTMDRDTRQAQLDALISWARTDAPAQLLLAGHPGRYLNAICTGFPEPSLRQWWESKLRFTFTCYDPYWYETAEHTVACGTAFTPGGNAAPSVRIARTLSAAASNQTYSNGSQSMVFSTIPAGSLVIDLDAQTAAVGSTSILQYLGRTSRFIKPTTGAQTITGTGTVHYRARWA